MDYTLKITMADPAGNRTAFVEGDVPPDQYATIGAMLLKTPSLRAEQAGFVCPPLSGGAGRLEMMGGEFCGNAARSFGLWLGVCSHKKPGDTVPVEISGSKEILNVLLEENGSWISMPRPERIIEIKVPERAGKDSGISASSNRALRFPAVVLEGITHVILENIKASETLAHAVIAEAAMQVNADAVGAIFVEGNRMTPIVWVRATDSFIWESSCGSGTLAAALWLGRGVKDGEYKQELLQPGGLLKAGFTAKDGEIIEAKIGGPVLLEEPVTITIQV